MSEGLEDDGSNGILATVVPSHIHRICMSEPETSARSLSSRIYSFGPFILDLERVSLMRGEKEVKLRRKSFELLRYFVENAGRLLSKNELIQSVWGDTFVTDDSLVQCVRDIRRALEDSTQQYIRTVPSRGYIFDTTVTKKRQETKQANELADVSARPVAAPLPVAAQRRWYWMGAA